MKGETLLEKAVGVPWCFAQILKTAVVVRNMIIDLRTSERSVIPLLGVRVCPGEKIDPPIHQDHQIHETIGEADSVESTGKTAVTETGVIVGMFVTEQEGRYE